MLPLGANSFLNRPVFKVKGSKFLPFRADPFSRETVKIAAAPSEKGSTLKGKNLLPLGANSFLPG